MDQAACTCFEPTHQLALVIVEQNWDTERIEAAEASVQFTCPKHGVRTPPIVRLSQSDADA
jgi:hypothetical protein